MKKGENELVLRRCYFMKLELQREREINRGSELGRLREVAKFRRRSAGREPITLVNTQRMDANERDEQSRHVELNPFVLNVSSMPSYFIDLVVNDLLEQKRNIYCRDQTLNAFTKQI